MVNNTLKVLIISATMLVSTFLLSTFTTYAATDNAEQIAAFSVEENASNYANMLRSEGKKTFIRVKYVNGKKLFAVMHDPSIPTEPIEGEPMVASEPMTTEEPMAAEEPMTTEEPMAVKEPMAVQEPMDTTTTVEDSNENEYEFNATEAFNLDAKPEMVTLPVKNEASRYTIEVSEGAPIYDRPFKTARIIGTVDGVGGGHFIREYLGWYAIELRNGSHVFINKPDAKLIER